MPFFTGGRLLFRTSALPTGDAWAIPGLPPERIDGRSDVRATRRGFCIWEGIHDIGRHLGVFRSEFAGRGPGMVR
jgi:hypothetical protein